MFKRTNKRAILRGIYEDNLSVKARPKSSGSDKSPVRKSSRRQLHLVTAFMGLAGIVATGWFVHWQLPKERDITDYLNQSLVVKQTGGPTADTSQASSKSSVPKLIAMDKEQSVKSGFDSNSLQKSLQKKLVEVDNLEGLEQANLEDQSLDPSNFEALAESGVSLAQLFGLSVKTIVIDPGHGGKDPGTVGKTKLYEKDVVLSIAQKLRDRLVAGGKYEVLMTRDSDETVPLNNRVEFANANSADLFISIHINYSTSKSSFIETYYFGATDDEKVRDLAKRENADSHYDYGDFKDIIQKLGDTLKYQESRQLAHSVQTSLFGSMKRINKHASDHGIKSAPFVVLLGLDTPSILTEVSCFCNPEEEKRLKTSEYQEKIAAFLEKGIVSYLNKNTSVGGKRNGEKEKLAKAQQ